MEPIYPGPERITIKVVARNARWDRLWQLLLAPPAESPSGERCLPEEGETRDGHTQGCDAEQEGNPIRD
jgi:hypothetical protein